MLDDYHLAQGAVLDRCLQFLLNHLPEGLVLLVTSRQRPDWHLARLRLSRQLLELSEQDLRLTAEESGALMAASGLELDETRWTRCSSAAKAGSPGCASGCWRAAIQRSRSAPGYTAPTN